MDITNFPFSRGHASSRSDIYLPPLPPGDLLNFKESQILCLEKSFTAKIKFYSYSVHIYVYEANRLPQSYIAIISGYR